MAVGTKPHFVGQTSAYFERVQAIIAKAQTTGCAALSLRDLDAVTTPIAKNYMTDGYLQPLHYADISVEIAVIPVDFFTDYTPEMDAYTGWCIPFQPGGVIGLRRHCYVTNSPLALQLSDGHYQKVLWRVELMPARLPGSARELLSMLKVEIPALVDYLKQQEINAEADLNFVTHQSVFNVIRRRYPKACQNYAQQTDNSRARDVIATTLKMSGITSPSRDRLQVFKLLVPVSEI
jgi:hypothetical protein